MVTSSHLLMGCPLKSPFSRYLIIGLNAGSCIWACRNSSLLSLAICGVNGESSFISQLGESISSWAPAWPEAHCSMSSSSGMGSAVCTYAASLLKVFCTLRLYSSRLWLRLASFSALLIAFLCDFPDPCFKAPTWNMGTLLYPKTQSLQVCAPFVGCSLQCEHFLLCCVVSFLEVITPCGAFDLIFLHFLQHPFLLGFFELQ